LHKKERKLNYTILSRDNVKISFLIYYESTVGFINLIFLLRTILHIFNFLIIKNNFPVEWFNFPTLINNKSTLIIIKNYKIIFKIINLKKNKKKYK